MVKLTFTVLLVIGHIIAFVSCDENDGYYDGRSVCKAKGQPYINSSCMQGGAFQVSCRTNRGGTHIYSTSCPGIKTCQYSTSQKQVECTDLV